MATEALLNQVKQSDLLRFTTTGSVDDGKSTLIGRLLHDAKSIYEDHLKSLEADSHKAGRDHVDYALLLDGLKAEREQGITIDVAYRHFSTPKRRFIIADVPGHEQYTRNMVTGASTADLAILLIDAQQGVLTQSKRHGFIASLLGIPHIVVAVNKMDLVDYSRDVFEQIREEYTAFTAKLQSRDITFIPVSAALGENVVRIGAEMPWYNGPSLLTHLETVHIAGDHNLIDLRVPVQYVLRQSADFRGYCGTVASGVVRVGEEVVALPSGRATHVTRILAAGKETDYAFSGQPVVICLEDNIDLSRGEMLARSGNQPLAAREIEALLIWMDERPLQIGKHYVIKHTTNMVRGQVSELLYRIDPNTLHREQVQTLGLNDVGRVNMDLLKPIFCDEYQRNRQTGSFIVIDPITNFTAGAGLVIDRSHRARAAGAHEVQRHITRHRGNVTADDRAKVLGQKPVTIWLTGLSGSGKSTIACALEKRLVAAGRACYVLDGDNIRQGLNRDLGFSAEDRSENIRRIAEVARLFNDAGLIVITAFISPFAADRQSAREIIGEGRFVEAFVDASIEVCEQRDPKGLYAKARAGKIPEFTGISSPYEPPESPEMRLDTSTTPVEKCVTLLMDRLRQAGSS
jgi:bifunctional enzyme CysN/CysC